MLNQIQLKRYAELSGYTEKALRDKISTGVWVEGLHYYRAPDRHILHQRKRGRKMATKRMPTDLVIRDRSIKIWFMYRGK